MGYTDRKVLLSRDIIIIGLFYGKELGTVIGDVDEITLWIYFGTELGSLDGSVDGSYYVKLEGLYFVE